MRCVFPLALGYGETGLLHEAIADLQTLIGKYDVAAQEYEAASAYQSDGRAALIDHKLGGLYERWANEVAPSTITNRLLLRQKTMAAAHASTQIGA